MSAIESFRVRIWCRDCTGTDPEGCFEGGTILLCEKTPGEKTSPWPVREFATIEEAKDAGWDVTADSGPWEFDVEDADGNKVFKSTEIA